MTQKRDSKTGRYTISKEAPPTATQESSPTKTKSSNEVLALTAKPKTVTVDARKGEHVIPTHKITKATRWVYRNGQCFALAVVLAEQNNTDVGLFVQFSELPWGTRYEELDMMPNVRKDWFNHARHAIALTEDSTSDDTFILDIDGKQSMSTVRKASLATKYFNKIFTFSNRLGYCYSKNKKSLGWWNLFHSDRQYNVFISSSKS